MHVMHVMYAFVHACMHAHMQVGMHACMHAHGVGGHRGLRGK